MKNFSTLFLISFLAVFFMVGSAMAIPYDKDGNVLANTTGYYWNDAPYWETTDTTTYYDGEDYFLLSFEQAAYESNFGLFIPDSFTTPTTVAEKFQVFGMSDEPLTEKSVYFRQQLGAWYVIVGTPVENIGSWTSFGNQFGFYYDVDSDSDSIANYSYYSDWSLNSVDKGDQHVAVEWDGINKVNIYLEDLQTASADWDWSDMTVKGIDIAPVPEPATLLLFGTGMLGLVGFRRKSK
jgi:hypothetical protein